MKTATTFCDFCGNETTVDDDLLSMRSSFAIPADKVSVHLLLKSFYGGAGEPRDMDACWVCLSRIIGHLLEEVVRCRDRVAALGSADANALMAGKAPDDSLRDDSLAAKPIIGAVNVEKCHTLAERGVIADRSVVGVRQV